MRNVYLKTRRIPRITELFLSSSSNNTIQLNNHHFQHSSTFQSNDSKPQQSKCLLPSKPLPPSRVPPAFLFPVSLARATTLLATLLRALSMRMESLRAPLSSSVSSSTLRLRST